MIFFKSLLILVFIIVAEVGNGIFRGKFITPKFGDFRARQISVFTGSFNILVISLASIRWINAETVQQLILVGLMWFVLMLAFEISLGKAVFKLSWSAIFRDFNLFEGRLLAIGMLYLLVSPYVAAKIMGLI